jgi:2-keto-4-pentenoate hydratase/2-oxohepta-3-ene-1,7-dioic acid hydratase in catechol pathway
VRIIRFIDDKGNEQLGSDRGDGSADVLAGSLFEGLSLCGETVLVGKLLSPLRPVDVYGIGLNYQEHCRLMGKEQPAEPPVFMKPISTLTNPGDPIQIPRQPHIENAVDYECELAVVIGLAARDVDPDEALEYVFGYTAANDVTDRNWAPISQIRGKGFDGFCPLGPTLVTANEVSDPQSLRLRTYVNDELMQDGNTSDMIFSVAEIISYLSRDTTLLPGTVILTGTPPGAAVTRRPSNYLQPGDKVTVEVEGIGALSNPVIGHPRSQVAAA